MQCHPERKRRICVLLHPNQRRKRSRKPEPREIVLPAVPGTVPPWGRNENSPGWSTAQPREECVPAKSPAEAPETPTCPDPRVIEGKAKNLRFPAVQTRSRVSVCTEKIYNRSIFGEAFV